jgi:hypothetical protein
MEQSKELLTEEQISEKAKIHVDNKFSLKIPSNELDDSREVLSTIGETKFYCQEDYKNGWKECQDYYKDLIKAGTEYIKLWESIKTLGTNR